MNKMKGFEKGRKTMKEKWWRIPVAFILLQLSNYQLIIDQLKTQVKHFLIESKLVFGVEKLVTGFILPRDKL